MPRILVTGAGGFLGRYAVEALAQADWSIVGTGRKAPDLPGLEDSLSADLMDIREMKRLVKTAQADVLLHLAWYDDPRLRWHAPDNLDWVATTLLLAREFSACGGQRLVFGSSCAVYDFIARGRHSEHDRPSPASLYGKSKNAAGQLLAAAAPSMNITFAEARMFFCYGAGEPAGRLVPDLIAGLASGRTVDCTDGQQRRDYLHASDIGAALALICGSDITGPVNVASGTSIPVAELISGIAQRFDRPDLVRLGAIPRPENDPPDIVADVARLQRIGFKPRYDLLDGIAETLAREQADR